MRHRTGQKDFSRYDRLDDAPDFVEVAGERERKQEIPGQEGEKATEPFVSVTTGGHEHYYVEGRTEDFGTWKAKDVTCRDCWHGMSVPLDTQVVDGKLIWPEEKKES